MRAPEFRAQVIPVDYVQEVVVLHGNLVLRKGNRFAFERGNSLSHLKVDIIYSEKRIVKVTADLRASAQMKDWRPIEVQLHGAPILVMPIGINHQLARALG